MGYFEEQAIKRMTDELREIKEVLQALVEVLTTEGDRENEQNNV